MAMRWRSNTAIITHIEWQRIQGTASQPAELQQQPYRYTVYMRVCNGPAFNMVQFNGIQTELMLAFVCVTKTAWCCDCMDVSIVYVDVYVCVYANILSRPVCTLNRTGYFFFCFFFIYSTFCCCSVCLCCVVCACAVVSRGQATSFLACLRSVCCMKWYINGSGR